MLKQENEHEKVNYLENLPTETLISILSKLPSLKDVKNFLRTNKAYSKYANKEFLTKFEESQIKAYANKLENGEFGGNNKWTLKGLEYYLASLDKNVDFKNRIFDIRKFINYLGNTYNTKLHFGSVVNICYDKLKPYFNRHLLNIFDSWVKNDDISFRNYLVSLNMLKNESSEAFQAFKKQLSDVIVEDNTSDHLQILSAYTKLLEAIDNHDILTIKELCGKGIPLNFNSLHSICQNATKEIKTFFIEMEQFISNNEKTNEFINNNHPNIKYFINARNQCLDSVLHFSCVMHNDLDLTKKILNTGLCTNFVFFYNGEVENVLSYFVKKNNLEMVKFIINIDNKTLHSQNYFKLPSLRIAVNRGDRNMIIALLNNFKDYPCSTNNGHLSIFKLFENCNDDEILKILIEYAKKINNSEMSCKLQAKLINHSQNLPQEMVISIAMQLPTISDAENFLKSNKVWSKYWNKKTFQKLLENSEIKDFFVKEKFDKELMDKALKLLNDNNPDLKYIINKEFTEELSPKAAIYGLEANKYKLSQFLINKILYGQMFLSNNKTNQNALINLLNNYEVDVNYNHLGEVPLYYAIQLRNVEVIKALLNKPNIDLTLECNHNGNAVNLLNLAFSKITFPNGSEVFKAFLGHLKTVSTEKFNEVKDIIKNIKEELDSDFFKDSEVTPTFKAWIKEVEDAHGIREVQNLTHSFVKFVKEQKPTQCCIS